MSAVKQLIVHAVGLTGSTERKPESSETQEVCIANISPRERRKRLSFAIIMTIVSIIVLVVLLATGASHWWRLGLFFLFTSAAIGFFQWHDKTCIAFARKNARKLGDHMETIDDPAELAQVRRQAQRIQNKSMLVGIVLTVIVLLLR